MATATKEKDATWTTKQSRESETTLESGRRLRIVQSVGRDSTDMFWYCYHMPAGEHGWRYLGVEKTMPLAKARAISGRMRMPGEELDEWLQRHGESLPDDLLEAERHRLAEWRKNPKPRAALEADIPSPRPARPQSGGKADGAVTAKPAVTESPKRTAGAKGERPAGKLAQNAVVRVLVHEPKGKPGSKWRTRQETVLASDGKRVSDINDNDAIKIMVRDGQIKLEEK